MSAYYNENDPKAAAWLRELIKENLIAPGEVDERSIKNVDPTDLEGFVQCHFFAGIGGWSYALRLAGWSDDREVWTGSCPCQPLSCAGQRKGHADERHLWPAFYALIDQRRPAIAFGEQVASKDGREWLAGVRADLEGIGYAIGASDLCAASVGAPHRRQRIFWMAQSHCRRSQERRPENDGTIRRSSSIRRVSSAIGAEITESSSDIGSLADDKRMRLERHIGNVGNGNEPRRLGAQQIGSASESGATSELAESNGGNQGNGELQRSGQHRQQQENSGTLRLGIAASGRQQESSERNREAQQITTDGSSRRPNANGSGERVGDTESRRCGVERDAALAPSGRHAERAIWSRFEIVQCRDGKARRFEPESFPLADGIPGRVALLRGYGNAIVPQVAAEFIIASQDIIDSTA